MFQIYFLIPPPPMNHSSTSLKLQTPIAYKTSLSKQPLVLPFSLRLSNFHPFICHTALHTAISLFLSIPLSLTIHSSVTFHNQLIWFQSYALNFTLHLFKCGLCIIFLSPLSWTRVQMHLCIYACLSHLCVSF